MIIKERQRKLGLTLEELLDWVEETYKKYPELIKSATKIWQSYETN